MGPMVITPTAVMELDGAAVHSMAAGKLNSCAVLSDGEAWTWGCGKGGKLGHGASEAIRMPSRVSVIPGSGLEPLRTAAMPPICNHADVGWACSTLGRAAPIASQHTWRCGALGLAARMAL